MKTGWMNDLLQMASNIFYDIAQSIEQLHYLLVAGNKFTFTKAFESSFFCLNSFIKKPLKNWKKLNLEKQDILFLQPYCIPSVKYIFKKKFCLLKFELNIFIKLRRQIKGIDYQRKFASKRDAQIY